MRTMDTQRDAARAFSAGAGLPPLVEFDNEMDVSGSKAKRPILEEILRQIDSGQLGGLVVSKLSRLARMSPGDRVRMFERVEAAGGMVLSAGEDIDPTTVSGRRNRDILLAVYRGEWEERAEEMNQAKRGAIEEGMWTAPRVPYGYLKDPETRRLVVDPIAASRVKETFERRAAGESWIGLARWLGKPFDERRVQRMIGNRCYLGESRQGKLVNRDAHSAIVGRALWESAQRHVGRPPQSGKRRLLSGLCKCRTCGRAMSVNSHGRTGQPKRHSYTCSWRVHCEHPASINADRVEDEVEAWVLARLRHIRDSVGAVPKTDDVDDAMAALTAAEKLLHDYRSPEVQASLPVAEWAAGLRERVAAVEAASEHVGRLHAQGSVTPVDIAESWDSLTVDERRLALAGVGVRVVIGPRGVVPRVSITDQL